MMTAVAGRGHELVPATCSVHIKQLSVQFGTFLALDGVSLSLAPGAVHAVVGQNGAGKTTLARCLMGLQQPSSGSIEFDDEPLALGSVKASKTAGVEMVHQAFSLPPSASVAEAIEFFHPSRTSLRPFRKRDLVSHVKKQLADLGVNIDPAAKISSLPVETLQSLEIGRALISRPRVLLLDEPTAVLAPQDVSALFDRVRAIAASGVTIIIVLHKVQEVFAIADTVTVLRGGVCVAAAQLTASFDERSLSEAIIGSAVPAPSTRSRSRGAPSELLSLQEITTLPKPGDSPLRNVTLTIFDSEILGIAGVEGNGQRSLVESIVGIQSIDSGSMRFLGHDVSGATVTLRRRLGLRVVPFDRLTEGVSTSRTLWENVAVGDLATHRSLFGLVSPRQLRNNARMLLDTWQVRYRDVNQSTGSLSGGNVQRLILARELAAGAKFLVAAHPTRGLDLGATAFVHNTISTLSETASVLLVSADLDELFALSDRIAVLSAGCVSGIFERPFDVQAIGAAMVGQAQISDLAAEIRSFS